jgi:hypothetical protein
MHGGHGHIHQHNNEEHGNNDAARNLALLTYMLEHNRQHADEIHEMAHALYHENKENAARLLDESLELFKAGNEKIAAALEILNKGE